MNKSESIKSISVALLKAQREMGDAKKDSKNPFFKSSYSDLNSIREACIPTLNAHNITVLQPIVVVDGKSFVETTLLHESGEFISGFTEVVCAKQNDPQAYGSGVSYSRRYGLQSLVCIGSVDDDGESAMGRTSKGVAAATTATRLAPSEGNVAPAAAKPSFRKAAAPKLTPKPEPVAEETSGDDL